MNRLPIERILDALKDTTGREPVESGAGWMACCPAHDDHNPSLSISTGKDGRVLLNCFSGCSTESVLAALGLTESDLFREQSGTSAASMSMKPHNSRERAGFHGQNKKLNRSKQNAPVFSTARPAIEPFEPFPVAALPQVVRTLVTVGSDAIGCAPAFIALPVLSVLRASIGNTRRLRLKPGWEVPPIIWTAIVGRSGSQKSPAWKLALSAVNELEKEADRRWRLEDAEYRAAVAEQKRDRRPAGESADSEEPSEQPTVPIAERFVVSDTTIEALATLLLENPRGLLLTVDELVGWIGSDRSTGSIELVEHRRTPDAGCRCSTPHRCASTVRPANHERSTFLRRR